jgi:hypothetical protein
MSTTAIINLIILSIICHGFFIAAIRVMMKAEDKKRAKASK